MEIANKFNYMTATPDLGAVLKYTNNSILQKLNCIKPAIVQSFDAEDLTVNVQIAEKKIIGINKDGTNKVADYPEIKAKICYACPFITYPIKKGQECLLLFSDREIESWFITGQAQTPSYTRMHSITDAFAIFGIRSIPQMIQIMSNCLNLFYGNGNIAIKENQTDIKNDKININTTTTIKLYNDSTTLLTLLNGLIDVIEELKISGNSFNTASVQTLEGYKATFATLLE